METQTVYTHIGRVWGYGCGGEGVWGWGELDRCIRVIGKRTDHHTCLVSQIKQKKKKKGGETHYLGLLTPQTHSFEEPLVSTDSR